MNYAVVLVSVAAYFSISWLVPWIEIGRGVSASYLFDFVIVLLGVGILRKLPILKVQNIKLELLRWVIAVFFAAACILIINQTKLHTPFKYVEFLLVQMIILAPIVEELVFRFSLFELAQRLKTNIAFNYLLNSVAFSVSHLPALWVLPETFHKFIYFQLGYTFVLGTVCTHIKYRKKSDLSSISFHFFFNLAFYAAVKLAFI